MTRKERMKLNVEEMLRVIAQFEARVAKDFGLKEGPLTGTCVHEYEWHAGQMSMGGAYFLRSYQKCKHCGKVRR